MFSFFFLNFIFIFNESERIQLTVTGNHFKFRNFFIFFGQNFLTQSKEKKGLTLNLERRLLALVVARCMEMVALQLQQDFQITFYCFGLNKKFLKKLSPFFWYFFLSHSAHSF